MAKIILKNVRCGYVFVTRRGKDKVKTDGTVEQGKYSIQVMMQKDHPQLKELRGLIATVAKEKFGPDVKAGMLKLPLRDGDAEREEDDFKNVFFFNSTSNTSPGIVNKYNKPPTPGDLEEYCFSGAIFHVSVEVKGFSNPEKKGVTTYLKNVMLRDKAPRLDNQTAAKDDFADYAEDAIDDFSDEDDDWDDF